VNRAVSKYASCRFDELSMISQEKAPGIGMAVESVAAEHQARNKERKKIQRRYRANDLAKSAKSRRFVHTCSLKKILSWTFRAA
jgi:hypothetical protein